MGWGAAIGAGAVIGGQILANRANKDIAKGANDFTRSTYQNRYQWTMDDMRAAGLNPMLAYQLGAGGAMPGATATMGNIGAGVLPAVNTALEADRVDSQVKKQKSEIENIKKDTELKKAQEHESQTRSALNQWQNLNVQAQTAVHSAQAQKVQQETVNAKLEEFRRQAIAEGAKSEKEIMETTLGKYLRWIDVVGRSVNPFARSVK